MGKKIARIPNRWLETVKRVRKANPDKSYKQCLVLAKQIYRK